MHFLIFVGAERHQTLLPLSDPVQVSLDDHAIYCRDLSICFLSSFSSLGDKSSSPTDLFGSGLSRYFRAFFSPIQPISRKVTPLGATVLSGIDSMFSTLNTDAKFLLGISVMSLVLGERAAVILQGTESGKRKGGGGNLEF